MINSYTDLVADSKKLKVQQVWEGFEIVLNWETRNKYRIMNAAGDPIAFAAEQSSGLAGTIMRQVLGHWRTFNIFVFNQQKQQILDLHFPFRWFFKALIVKTHHGQIIGRLEQRFSFIYKKFDVLDPHGKLIATIKSPLWKMWTFDFQYGSRKLGDVQKKWAGIFGELFTDKDNFEVNFADPNLSPELKALMLATCLMVDIVYFENNHKN